MNYLKLILYLKLMENQQTIPGNSEKFERALEFMPFILFYKQAISCSTINCQDDFSSSLPFKVPAIILISILICF